ncbi:MAG TPA: tRNA guanosine(34) transglycosylase Tgt [Ktedonobacterales bacterium]
MNTCLRLPHGDVRLPAFLPDATLGVVRGVDSMDLENCGIEALVMNSFHLMQRPGSSTVQALGGLHQMAGWQRPIVTDSGGFQAYSLIRQNPKYGSLNDRGITFQPDGAARKFHFSPEKTIQLQLSYGADVVICLDDCTHVDDTLAEQEVSVQRTIAWARRCKREFERRVAQKEMPPAQRPLLFGVIQGGGSFDLRKRCASELLEIGFDGFGFGGWPLDDKGNLLTEIIAYTRSLVPPALPMHALGVGHPANVVECFRLGYDLFDSAMPTRDARHGRLYRFEGEALSAAQPLAGKWFSYIYINDDQHMKSDQPISSVCDGLCCRRYSQGYLRHLFKVGDSLFIRLATIHNLSFMAQLMRRLQTLTAPNA